MYMYSAQAVDMQLHAGCNILQSVSVSEECLLAGQDMRYLQSSLVQSAGQCL